VVHIYPSVMDRCSCVSAQQDFLTLDDGHIGRNILWKTFKDSVSCKIFANCMNVLQVDIFRVCFNTRISGLHVAPLRFPLKCWSPAYGGHHCRKNGIQTSGSLITCE
jgi:hypothetical protein